MAKIDRCPLKPFANCKIYRRSSEPELHDITKLWNCNLLTINEDKRRQKWTNILQNTLESL